MARFEEGTMVMGRYTVPGQNETVIAAGRVTQTLDTQTRYGSAIVLHMVEATEPVYVNEELTLPVGTIVGITGKRIAEYEAEIFAEAQAYIDEAHRVLAEIGDLRVRGLRLLVLEKSRRVRALREAAIALVKPQIVAPAYAYEPAPVVADYDESPDPESDVSWDGISDDA